MYERAFFETRCAYEQAAGIETLVVARENVTGLVVSILYSYITVNGELQQLL